MKERAFESISSKKLGSDIVVGSDVEIVADEAVIGDGVRIGDESDEEAFRIPGGVRIRVRRLNIGDNTRISRGVLIKGGDISIGNNVTIREHCTINVKDRISLGDGGYVNPYCRIMGRDIEILSNFRMLTWASIGGGSCFEVQSKLRVGNNCHLGEFSFINTADEVQIGEEVGIGMRSAIFTHGAYQSFIDGYPVTFGPIRIEDNCWLPQAIVLPNVTIGKGTVVATGSLVNRNLPAYCLAGGVPAKVIRENIFSSPPNDSTKIQLMNEFLTRLDDILRDVFGDSEKPHSIDGFSYANGASLQFIPSLTKEALSNRDFESNDVIITFSTDKKARELIKDGKGCVIVLDDKEIIGDTNDFSNRVVDQLRRYGIRFK